MQGAAANRPVRVNQGREIEGINDSPCVFCPERKVQAGVAPRGLANFCLSCADKLESREGLTQLFGPYSRSIEPFEVVAEMPGKPTFFILGGEITEAFYKFEAALARLSTLEKVMLVRESIVNGHEAGEAFIGAPGAGLTIGAEDPLADLFCSLLDSCYPFSIYSVHQSLPEPTRSRIVDDYRSLVLEHATAFLVNINFRTYGKAQWTLFMQSIEAAPVGHALHSLHENKVLKAIKKTLNADKLGTKKLAYNLRLPRMQEWILKNAKGFDKLAAYFGQFLLFNEVSKLPEDRQLDAQKVRKYLANPLDQDDLGLNEYVNHQVITGWRDLFIKDNLLKAYHLAKEKGRDLVFPVGWNHLHQILPFLSH